MKRFPLKATRFLYLNIGKPFLFLFDAEAVHGFATSLGAVLGAICPLKWLMKKAAAPRDASFTQTVAGIRFAGPIGLAAGFDYEARLTQILPAVGFGFETVGTITNGAYEGNKKPRLGRLPKSRSLLVNKGFKNRGIRAILAKLSGKKFEIPIGISIGVTNSPELSSQELAIADISAAFDEAEKSSVSFSYYELNISCPNLRVKTDFYSPENLSNLLAAVTGKKLRKPLFVKMPIDKTDGQALAMLETISRYPVQGIIFGNLQRSRDTLVPEEVALAVKGGLSGKPTEKRSNELIALAYRNYGNKLAIVGCGGVFNAEDAYRKIRLGASLIQMITGMIYEGPQLIGEINLNLAELLKRDGFSKISDAVGADNRAE